LDRVGDGRCGKGERLGYERELLLLSPKDILHLDVQVVEVSCFLHQRLQILFFRGVLPLLWQILLSKPTNH
jgi:hypothetical protein